jgi:hypothetical protein
MTRTESLFGLAREFYTIDDPGHDFAHVRRVKFMRDFLQQLGSEINIPVL